MNRKSMYCAALTVLLIAVLASPARAHSLSPHLTPSFVRYMFACAGIHAELFGIVQQTGAAGSLYVEDFKDSRVVIGFPPSGITRDSAFMLEINGMSALVCMTKGHLHVIAGDRGVEASGIFGTLECMLNQLQFYLEAALNSLLDFDILGFFENIVEGIFEVIICIIY